MIFYEDLLAYPQRELQRIMKFLHVEIEAVWNRQVTSRITEESLGSSVSNLEELKQMLAPYPVYTDMLNTPEVNTPWFVPVQQYFHANKTLCQEKYWTKW